CIQCGSEFIPRNVAHKLCSEACRYAHHLVDRRVRYRLRVGIPLDAPVQRPHAEARVVDGVPCCVVCGGVLPGGSATNRRLCSRECRLARRRELERAAREQRVEPVDDEPVDWERVVRSIAERSGVEAAAQFLDSLNARRRTAGEEEVRVWESGEADRKSTRLNSSHVSSSYAVFCLKQKSNRIDNVRTSGRHRCLGEPGGDTVRVLMVVRDVARIFGALPRLRQLTRAARGVVPGTRG